jgi:chromate transporter
MSAESKGADAGMAKGLPAKELPNKEPPRLRDLFLGFLGLGLMGFGGVLPLARRMIVEERGWLSGAEFTELLGLCQFVPGGNIINLSVAVGLQYQGIAGAFASLVGLLAAPSLIVIALGVIYDRSQDNPYIQHMFMGLAAAAAGLLLSMALKMALPLWGRPVAILFCALCFIAIAILQLPLLPTMLVLTPLSILALKRIGT